MITISEIKELNIYSHLYTEVLLKIEELLKLAFGIEWNCRKSFLRKSVHDMSIVAYLKNETCALSVLSLIVLGWKNKLSFTQRLLTPASIKELTGENVFIEA